MKRPTRYCTCDNPTPAEWHGLTICSHCECFYAYPDPSPSGIVDTKTGFIVGGAPTPTNLLSQQIVPRASDIDYWTAQEEESRRTRQLAGAVHDGDGTDQERLQAAALIELARRKLRGVA
jgi:hypothetical protein